VVYRLSDNDIGVTRKDPTKPGKYRPGYEEAMRLVDARMVDAVLCFKWDRFIRALSGTGSSASRWTWST
jgi:hypothetical protein